MLLIYSINKPFNQRMGGMTDNICIYKYMKCIYNIQHPYHTHLIEIERPVTITAKFYYFSREEIAEE